MGEIAVSGPSVTKGYYNNPDATAESWKDGWLHTGDLGYTVDGNLYVCGRIKDLIIIRGANYYPQDIEWVVGDLEKVRRGNVVAFSVTDDGTEELVVVAEGNSADASDLRRAITEDFGRVWAPAGARLDRAGGDATEDVKRQGSATQDATDVRERCVA